MLIAKIIIQKSGIYVIILRFVHPRPSGLPVASATMRHMVSIKTTLREQCFAI
jgi:hypothetical protein